MADEADIAFDLEQRHLTQALAAQRARSAVLRPVGYCHNCANDDVGTRLFCDADCAADWEYQDALRRRLGLPATAGFSGAGGPGQHAAAH